MLLRSLLIFILLFVLSSASAKAESSEFRAGLEPAERNFVNLRLGASSAANSKRPVICMEIEPIADFSFESCGTGSGLLHNDPDAELAHFRLKTKLYERALGGAKLGIYASFGFAELQIAEDEPGFKFFKPETENPVETAGPEIGAGLKYLKTISSGFEWVGDLNIGGVWLEYAPLLISPRDRMLFYGELSFGFGW